MRRATWADLDGHPGAPPTQERPLPITITCLISHRFLILILHECNIVAVKVLLADFPWWGHLFFFGEIDIEVSVWVDGDND